jgi:hypothetical protein
MSEMEMNQDHPEFESIVCFALVSQINVAATEPENHFSTAC